MLRSQKSTGSLRLPPHPAPCPLEHNPASKRTQRQREPPCATLGSTRSPSKKQWGWGIRCSNHPRLLKCLTRVLPDTAGRPEVEQHSDSSAPHQPPPAFPCIMVWPGCTSRSESLPTGASVIPCPLLAPPLSPAATLSQASRRIPGGGRTTRADPTFHLPRFLLLDPVLATWDQRAVPILAVTWLAWQRESSREEKNKINKSV